MFKSNNKTKFLNIYIYYVDNFIKQLYVKYIYIYNILQYLILIKFIFK